LLSEIMLQQTTVNVVIPYYEKFLKAFPKIEDLALVDEEKLFSLWSGLGYCSRAKNLLKTAQIFVSHRAFSEKYEELLALPGIGPYTAAAVSSIAFNHRVAAIDGNVIRVITRLFDIAHPIDQLGAKQEIQVRANELIQEMVPSQHNQAMMELG